MLTFVTNCVRNLGDFPAIFGIRTLNFGGLDGCERAVNVHLDFFIAGGVDSAG